MATQAICDVAAHSAVARQFAAAYAPSGSPMTRAAAIAMALQAGGAPPGTTVFSRRMSLADYDALAGDGLTSGQEKATVADVWVVTVHAPMYTDGSPASRPQRKDVYTLVYDVASGKPMEIIIGGDVITS